MDFLGNLVINSICMAILVVLFSANIKNTRGKIFGPRMFQLIISSGILLFAVDIIGRMDGLTSLSVPLANQIGNFLLFALNPLPPILWLIYVIYQVAGDTKLLKRLSFPFAAYFAANLVLVIVNLFFGYYYTIDSSNVYARGPVYPLAVIWAFLPLLVSFVITLMNHRRIDSRKYSAFLFFPIAPIIGTILSFFTYGYSIVLPSMAIGYLLLFISIQSDTMRVDYLTGAFNRRHLEDCLRRKMSENNPSFAAIMLDIDCYKKINDTYGHLVGDRALVDFARVLRKAVGVNDIVARYGGDEFMIIVAVNNINQLNKLVDEIREHLERFNAKKVYPFKLTASFGQAMYIPSEKKTMEQFINHVDDLMYKNKKTNCLLDTTSTD
jgi:diguanylate cyclase (GGDEF)-like protein